MNASSFSFRLFIVFCRLIKFNLSLRFIITSSELFGTGLSCLGKGGWFTPTGLSRGVHRSLNSTSDRLQTQHRLFQQLQRNKLPTLAPEQNAQQGRIHLAAYKLIEMQGGALWNLYRLSPPMELSSENCVTLSAFTARTVWCTLSTTRCSPRFVCQNMCASAGGCIAVPVYKKNVLKK